MALSDYSWDFDGAARSLLSSSSGGMFNTLYYAPSLVLVTDVLAGSWIQYTWGGGGGHKRSFKFTPLSSFKWPMF
jgi:hypothetical protein